MMFDMLPRDGGKLAASIALRRAGQATRLLVIASLLGGLTLTLTVTQVIPAQELPRAVPGVPVPIPVTDARLREPEPDSWLMYRRTYDGLGYSPLREINTSNVADLAPAWIISNRCERRAASIAAHRKRPDDVRDDLRSR